MVLDIKIRSIVNANLDTSISVYNELKSKEETLKKFTMQFGDIENNFDFIHGYISGDLQGQVFGTVRTILNRPLNNDERNELVEIIQSKKEQVRDLIERLKNA